MSINRKIKGIADNMQYYLHGGISRTIDQKRIERYASIIYSEILEENRKLSGTTMMIKGPRKSDELTTNRATHQDRAAGIAMITADKLGLNTKIVEIAGRNHDLGHTPYGHSVEWWESEILKDMGMGYRCHNAIGVKRLIYSAQIYDKIINKIKEFYPELSQNKLDKIRRSLWLVLDPMLCHNGESSKRKLMVEANLDKQQSDFQEDLEKCYYIEDYDRKLVPGTAEGSLFRIVDVISYVGQDMIDGLREGIITDLDSEYRQILQNFGITSEEIDLAIAKKSYDGLAKKIEIVATKDLIENSSKRVVKLSPEMLQAVCVLKDKNNKEIVDKIVRPTENQKYPQAIRQLFNEFSNVVSGIGDEVLGEIMCGNLEQIQKVQELYKDSQYSGFITYLCNLKKEDYDFTAKMVMDATAYSMKEELEEALKGELSQDVKFSMRNKRIQEMMRDIKEQYPNGMTEEDKKEYLSRYTHRKTDVEPSEEFIPMSKRIGISLGANYIETLNDREFVELLKKTNLLTPEELADINIKYNQLSQEELAMDTRQDKWKEVAGKQRADIVLE